MPAFDRWGVLLMNLGTPDSAKTTDVRRYLNEFLSDPRVLDMNPVMRRLLLNFVILPKRPALSAEAYEKIWTPEGSPLALYTEDLQEGLQRRLPNVQVEHCMRYQQPPVRDALAAFRAKGVDRIVLVPLFPHNSSAAWGSAVQEVYEAASELWNVPSIHVVPPFYDHPEFIESFVEVAQPVLTDLEPDHVLMSFHGLPERHCHKSDASEEPRCLTSPDCCASIVHANRNCYRAQCFETARLLAQRLDLAPEDYTVSFQSRLGRDPWIKPYTDEAVTDLAERGFKRVAVLSPAFVADCLETLEEIAMGLSEDFHAKGGGELRLVPSLNGTPRWMDALERVLREETPVGQQLARDAAEQ